MMPLDLFPVALVSAVEVPKVNASPIDSKDLPGEVDYSRSNRDLYSSGEMGVFYGTTTGKFGYETKQAYIQGTVGNDKFQITAGVSSEESSFPPILPPLYLLFFFFFLIRMFFCYHIYKGIFY